MNQAFMVEMLQKNIIKDINKKKILAWAKKLEQWILEMCHLV